MYGGIMYYISSTHNRVHRFEQKLSLGRLYIRLYSVQQIDDGAADNPGAAAAAGASASTREPPPIATRPSTNTPIDLQQQQYEKTAEHHLHFCISNTRRLCMLVRASSRSRSRQQQPCCWSIIDCCNAPCSHAGWGCETRKDNCHRHGRRHYDQARDGRRRRGGERGRLEHGCCRKRRGRLGVCGGSGSRERGFPVRPGKDGVIA